MACGDNHVTRSHLSSQPTPINSASVALSKAQVQAALARPRLPMISVDGREPKQAYQSWGGYGQVHYFIGPDGQQTHEPSLHIHVIHKANGDVTMHITNRRDHTRSTELVLEAPDGNLVRDAELALAEILRSLQ